MPENKNIEIKLEDSENRAQGQEIPEKQSNLEKNQKTPQENNATGEETSEEKLHDPIKKMESRIEELEKEVETNYDRFIRVTADFENYKKRTAREISDLRKFANENILKDMLSAVDNLERAIESGSKQDSEKQTLLEGVEITLKDLFRIFEKYGVKDFKSEGEPFNPVFHQAMMQEQTNDYPDNTVLNELQKGYTIHERLLRPAMVVVAKNAPDKQFDETDETEESN
jgi:molecular chaperone GrpE